MISSESIRSTVYQQTSDKTNTTLMICKSCYIHIKLRYMIIPPCSHQTRCGIVLIEPMHLNIPNVFSYRRFWTWMSNHIPQKVWNVFLGALISDKICQSKWTLWLFHSRCLYIMILFAQLLMHKVLGVLLLNELAEWRSGSVSALPCERPGFASRTRLREIIPANNCTMQEQNNWGNWGSPGVMKLWVAWEVLRWLMKFRELCSGGFHPKLVTPPYHGFLNANTPQNSQNSKRH